MRDQLLNNVNTAPTINFGGLSTNQQSSLELPKNIQDNLFYKFDFIHSPSSVYDGSASTTASNNINSKYAKKKTNSQSANHDTHLSVFKVKTRELSNYLEKYVNKDDVDSETNNSSDKVKVFTFTGKDGNSISYDLYRANIVWDLGDPLVDDVAAHRFQDNDELKYSLRSLEKYAPWVRNIYIVTNGQQPSWLNTSHPRVKLITHEQIFQSKSHLPTFSSPAIESHIHRIPGLSNRFLYFNDDTLLGAPVWPDDFFTYSKGFRFHLAWSLPGCNANCPNSWIRDGYCDKPCNTAECDFDGGDCDKKYGNKSRIAHLQDTARQMFLNQSVLALAELYCSPACANSWLADKYCDKACNTLNCAYDMGDCGVDRYKDELYHVDLFRPNEIETLAEAANIVKNFYLPFKTMYFYVNFTASVLSSNGTDQPFRINKAMFEENKLVRSISAVNKFGTLTVLMISSNNSQGVNNSSSNLLKIFLEGSFGESKPINLTLNLFLNAFDRDNETDPNFSIESMNVTVQKRTTKLRKLINVKSIDPSNASPKNNIISVKNITQLPSSASRKPITNKLFKNLYDNYHDYLKWSLKSGYLTEKGLEYKLNLLYDKIKNDMNQTFSLLSEKVDLTNLDKKDDLTLNFLFDFMFKNTNGLFFSELDKSELINEYLNETSISGSGDSSVFVQFKKRKLLDTFADSLRHVNRLYNQIYGYMARKVPAHMPHFIDRYFNHIFRIYSIIG